MANHQLAVSAVAAAAALGVAYYIFRRARGGLHVSLAELDEIVDPHHHYFDYKTNSFHSFLEANAMPKCLHLPSMYLRDIGRLPVRTSVHVEAIPDTGLEEVTWLDALANSSAVADVVCEGIVASWNPATKDVAALDAIVKAAPRRVRGIRWICNYDGALAAGESYVASRATWPRVEANFFLEGAAITKAFEEGLRLLSERGLSFDLQANPAQLEGAAKMLAKLPSLRVVVDHIGTPRDLKLDGSAVDDAELKKWRDGMQRLAALPNVYVKLSMVNYAVGGCFDDPARASHARALVREVIELFGARRCMFNSNWPVDGPEHGGPTMERLYSAYAAWTADLPLADRKRLFAGTAREFYKLM